MPRRRVDLTDRLRVLLIGCGVMGTRHAAVIARDPTCVLLALDRLPERARAVAERFGGRAVDAIPDEVDIAIVATPTGTHAYFAAPLLARGVWCLVEKPLADTAAEARRLAHPRCAVGHVERFNRALRAAGPLAPRTIDLRRISPPTGRSLDVDVVSDLMIHDLDLVLGWAAPGGSIAWIDAAGTADTAVVRLRTTCGISASLVASRAADRRERMIRSDEPGGLTVLDLLNGRTWRNGIERHTADPRDALTCQWENFVAAVRGREALPDSGIRAVELADRVRLTIREGEAPGARP